MDESETLHDVPLDEAIAIALVFQKGGQLEAAGTIYGKILEALPDHADVLHYSGVLAHQQGRSAEAVEIIQRSLALDPDRAECYNNLGIVLKALKRFDEAIAAYQRAIALEPDHANAYSNLGVLLRAQGRPAEAEEAYRTAIRLNPEHVDALTNLGILLAGLGRVKEAVACHCKAATLEPRRPETRRLLAMAYCTLGEREKAVDIYREWLAEEPDNPIPRHMLAACSGEGVPSRASDAYVERAFDNFASSFDSKLASLSYRAPALVAAMLADAGQEASGTLDVLDAGCGTGLCGPLVASHARRLVGVDLSGGMLAQAEERHVYDELVRGELTEYLRGHEAGFDAIVSADTLVYFGALDKVFAAASAALRPGGRFVFTLEEDTAGDAVPGHRLQLHGRYCHTQRYVERALEGAGLRGEVLRAELRMESGVPVAGLVVRATKPGGALVTAEPVSALVRVEAASAPPLGGSHA